MTANHLLADRGYDTNAVLAQAARQGMIPVIPPRKHRVVQRYYDKYLYKLRHLVENAVLHSSVGAASLPATPRKHLPSSLPSKFAASLFGSPSRDYTI
jgi:hypothetical protein